MRDWQAFVRGRLALPRLRPERESRIVRELAEQLEDIYTHARAGGASETEADRLARQNVRDWAALATELDAADRAHRRARLDRWTETAELSKRRKRGRSMMFIDACHEILRTLRTLGRSRSFSLLSSGTLALGIGATVTVFTLVQGILLSPLPFPAPERLVSLTHTAPSRGIENAGQCAAWHFTYEDENRVFENIGMYGGRSMAVTGLGEAEAVPGMVATGGVFRALGLVPILGRSFTAGDEDPESEATVLLGHGYWRSHFGGDPDVVGQSLRVDGELRQIIGVMPASLTSLGGDPALVLPLRFQRENLFVGNIGYEAVARLRPGVTLERATADAERLLPLAWEKFPGGPVGSSSHPESYRPILRPLEETLVAPVAGRLYLLLGGALLVLLIAAANVANLFLVRAEGRATEMAVRSALGANLSRIGWEHMKESLVLGALGGLVGLGLARAALSFLIGFGPRLPRMEEVGLTPALAVSTLVMALAAGAALGLLGILRQGRSLPSTSLKRGGLRGVAGRGGHRVQNTLAISQVALALVLLAASTLMLRSFLILGKVDPGFGRPEEVLALRLFIPFSEVETPEEVARRHQRIAQRLSEIPGVRAVGLGSSVPMDGATNVNPLYVEGLPAPDGSTPSRQHKWIGHGYLEALQIPIVAGRSFTAQEIRDRFPGVLLSESLARELFGSAEAALGRRLSVRPDPVRWHEIIGVAGNVRQEGMDQDPAKEVLWPQVTLAFWEGTTLDQVQTWRGMGYAIRSDRVGTAGLLRDVREAVRSVDPNLPLTGVRTLPELMARSMARTSFMLVLLATASGIALMLGAVGLYGVIAYGVRLRMRELGLRVALGATKGNVETMVLKQGLVLSMAGVAIGLPVSLAFGRLMASLLYEVSPTDPMTHVLVTAALIAVALVASYLPARWAASVDPMSVLRLE